MLSTLRAGLGTVGCVVISLLLVAAVAVAAVFIFGGANRLTAPFRGETEKIERTEGDGAFRISSYEEFFELCAAVQVAEGRADSLEAELKTKPPADRVTQINTSLTAVRANRTEMISQYNAKAAQEHRAAFLSADLPARLAPHAGETPCAA